MTHRIEPAPPTADLAAARLNAHVAAHNWANITGVRKHVIENAGRFFIADDQDLDVYHQADIDAGRAVAWVVRPATPTVAVLDVAFAPVGWAE
jgi:hypothetical protein